MLCFPLPQLLGSLRLLTDFSIPPHANWDDAVFLGQYHAAACQNVMEDGPEAFLDLNCSCHFPSVPAAVA